MCTDRRTFGQKQREEDKLQQWRSHNWQIKYASTVYVQFTTDNAFAANSTYYVNIKLGIVENVSVNYEQDKLLLQRSHDFLSVAEAETKMSAPRGLHIGTPGNSQQSPA